MMYLYYGGKALSKFNTEMLHVNFGMGIGIAVNLINANKISFTINISTQLIPF